MSEESPTIVLVHGAFAESASWNPVVEQLQAHGYATVAVANPLRSVSGDAAYVRDVVAGTGGPVVLVAHSYGGMVISEAASENSAVKALVFVAGFAPDQGESALQLSGQFPGSTLPEALTSYPVSSGGDEVAIQQDRFHQQFAADVDASVAALMAATQRPITVAALSEGLPTAAPAWRSVPAWFVFGDRDMNIPVALHRWQAERAGAKGICEVTGASHALSVSEPSAVVTSILDAVAAT